MGYESSGYGALTLRNPAKVKEAEKALMESYFDCPATGEGHYNISFGSGKIYGGWDLFSCLLEHFNGEIDIRGEDDSDIWKLLLKDGKAFHRQGRIVYDEPVPFNMKTMEVE